MAADNKTRRTAPAAAARPVLETTQEARERFLGNYRRLAAQPSLEWFEGAVEPLIRIALHVQPQPINYRPYSLTG